MRGRGRRGRPGRPSPALVLAALVPVAFLAVPPAYLAYRAGVGEAWGVMGARTTWETMWRTLTLLVGVAAGSVLVGASTAWLVARTELPWRRFWAVMAVLPLAMPSFVAALALAGATGTSGLASRVLAPLGIGPVPRLEGYWGATLAVVASTAPYVYLLTAAALRRIDPAQEEAARVLGRGPLGAFVAASLPQLRRALAAGALLAALYAVSDFGAVALMRYTTITRAIFTRYEAGFDRTPAAVLGLVLVALAVLLLVAETRSRGADAVQVGPGARRTPTPIPLGRFTPLAVAWLAALTCLFVVTPLAVMTYWIARAAGHGTLDSVPWRAGVTSLALAAVAAVIATVAAVPVTYLAQRHPRRWTMLLERAGYGANALPGIVVGLALVFIGARYLPWLYQTFPLLVAAYVIRFFAEALSGVGTALSTVSPRTEEAARVLGRSPLRVFGAVTLPQMRPGLAASAVLVFLSVVKELPATALLLPTGARTLATEVWRKTTVGAYGAAAVAAVTLMVLSLPFIWLAVREHVLARHPSSPPGG